MVHVPPHIEGWQANDLGEGCRGDALRRAEDWRSCGFPPEVRFGE